MMGFLLFKPEPGNIAMIGLGGGSLAKFCHRDLPRSRIQAIEINPHVRWFWAQPGRLLGRLPGDQGGLRVAPHRWTLCAGHDVHRRWPGHCGCVRAPLTCSRGTMRRLAATSTSTPESRPLTSLTSKCGSATLLDPHGGRSASAGLGALKKQREEASPFAYRGRTMCVQCNSLNRHREDHGAQDRTADVAHRSEQEGCVRAPVRAAGPHGIAGGSATHPGLPRRARRRVQRCGARRGARGQS